MTEPSDQKAPCMLIVEARNTLDWAKLPDTFANTSLKREPFVGCQFQDLLNGPRHLQRGGSVLRCR